MINTECHIIHCVFAILGVVHSPCQRVQIALSVSGVLQQVRHEGDVDDGQAERLDTRQPLLIGECGNFPPQFIKRFVQAKHPFPLPHIGRLSLDHGDDPPPFGLGVTVPPAAVVRRCAHQTPGAQLGRAQVVFQIPAPRRVVQMQLVVRSGCAVFHLPLWS